MEYSEVSKGYRVLDLKTNKIIVSRTVKFNENINECFQDMNGCKSSEYTEVAPTVIINPEKQNKNVENENSQELFDEENSENTSGLVDEKIEDNDFLEENDDKIVITRTGRISKKKNYDDYITYNVVEYTNSDVDEKYEPKSVKEAMSRSNKKMWEEAMNREYQSMMSNKSWVIVKHPENKNVVQCKWVFCKKRTVTGEVRYKARLVAKSFTQEYGVDYFETFFPVVRNSAVRLLFALAVELRLDIDHLDVETAFLNGDLNEEIYMTQPEGFIQANSSEVCLLKKAIYGLKQSSRVWSEKVRDVLLKLNFKQSPYEPCTGCPE